MSSATPLSELLTAIRACRVCEQALGHDPRPVLFADANARVAIIGQAPGRKVHESGVAWDDASGERLRMWLGVSRSQFYDDGTFAIVPMGFCYPGKGKSGDLPPRPECAPLWHDALFEHLPDIRLRILVGAYAQGAYLGTGAKPSLTESVRAWREFGPDVFPLPHPSPRNNIWLKKHTWFEDELVPELQHRVQTILGAT